MQPASHFGRYAIFTIVFSIVIAIFYGPQLMLWNNQIPGSGEDGAKNIFTVDYHIQHDEGLIWFDGMNYPQGDHVVYTDNQPLVSNFLKLIGGSSQWLPWLVFISALVGGLLFFAMLVHAGIPWLFSLLFSIGIMLLSPQLLRLGGHYSLAYVCLIPMLFYLIWKESKSQILLNKAATVLLIVCAAFIHPYFLMMMAFFWGTYLMVDLFAKRKLRDWKSWLSCLIWPLLPIVVFQLIMLMTDPVGDRPTNPYGFLAYRATWSSIFLPLDLNYFSSLSMHFTNSMEGAFFIGLFAILGLLLALLIAIRKRSFPLGFHQKLLIASIPLLLLSVAFPFYIWKFDRLVEYLGPLKQFRGIARFSFVFFYAVNFFAAIEIGRFLKKRNPRIKIIFSTLIVAVLLFESWSFRNHLVDKTSNGSTAFYDNPWPEIQSEIEVQSFQCILPLPYFHIGSENFRTPEVEGLREQAFALSLATGVPLHSVQMSRTSLTQTLEHLQMVSFLSGKAITSISDGYSSGSLLLLVKQNEQLSENQQRLVAVSKPVLIKNDYQLRELEMSDFVTIAQNNVSRILMLRNSASLVSPTGDHLYFRSFDDAKNDRFFSGESGLKINRLQWTELVPPYFSFEPKTEYELSFWFYVNDQQAASTQLWFWERKNGKDVRFELTEIGDHLTQVMNGWILVTLPISISEAGNTIQVMIHRDGVKMDLWLDEVMIRKADENYFRPGSLNLNNRYIEPPSQ